ncbi:hypothetical protein JYT83_00870 [bacterium AH-315-F18]|nr:hypothetical protein [bacterium AH-315-F18]
MHPIISHLCFLTISGSLLLGGGCWGPEPPRKKAASSRPTKVENAAHLYEKARNVFNLDEFNEMEFSYGLLTRTDLHKTPWDESTMQKVSHLVSLADRALPIVAAASRMANCNFKALKGSKPDRPLILLQGFLQVLHYKGRLQVSLGQTDDAIATAGVLMRMGAHINETAGPSTLMGPLAAMGCLGKAATIVRGVMACPDTSRIQLSNLNSDLASLDAAMSIVAALVAIQNDGASLFRTLNGQPTAPYDDIEKLNHMLARANKLIVTMTDAIAPDGPKGEEPFQPLRVKPGAYKAEAEHFSFRMTKLLEIYRNPNSEIAKETEPILEACGNGHMVERFLLPPGSMRRHVFQNAYGRSLISLLRLVAALETFRTTSDRLPETLDELPKTLRVTTDPLTQQRWDYKRTESGYEIRHPGALKYPNERVFRASDSHRWTYQTE